MGIGTPRLFLSPVYSTPRPPHNSLVQLPPHAIDHLATPVTLPRSAAAPPPRAPRPRRRQHGLPSDAARPTVTTCCPTRPCLLPSPHSPRSAAGCHTPDNTA